MNSDIHVTFTEAEISKMDLMQIFSECGDFNKKNEWLNYNIQKLEALQIKLIWIIKYLSL